MPSSLRGSRVIALSLLVSVAALAGCTAPDSDSTDQGLILEADPLAGSSQLSGTVTAAAPFTAAQVYTRNLAKNMLYTAFTNKGQYRAINLLPGGYEVWAEKGKLRSEHEMLPRQTDNPNTDRTREGAIIYTTRSNQQAAIGIFYPDASKMTGYGAYG